MRVLVRMAAMGSNTTNYLRRRYREERAFFESDARYALWERTIGELQQPDINPDKARQLVDPILVAGQQPQEGQPRHGADAGEYILWLRLELQRRWLAWLVDFTVRELQARIEAMREEDGRGDVLYVVTLPEFYFTDRSRGLTDDVMDRLNQWGYGRIHQSHFRNPFERRILYEFANGWLPTYQRLQTLESLAGENVILFAGTIVWKLTSGGQEIINNTLPVFFENSCRFLWDKQVIPEDEIPPENMHPSVPLPWLSIEAQSAARRPYPAFEYVNPAVCGRPMVFSMDICRDFLDGTGKRLIPEDMMPDFHVVVAAGAQYRAENVCARNLVFYCDNKENLDWANAMVVGVDQQKIFDSISFHSDHMGDGLCWASRLIGLDF